MTSPRKGRSRSPKHIAVKRNEKLWEKVKKQVTDSSKGGESGKWSDRFSSDFAFFGA